MSWEYLAEFQFPIDDAKSVFNAAIEFPRDKIVIL